MMQELIKNGIRISEIYTDKPNLENVFLELINRPAKKTSLKDFVDEIVAETSEPTAADETDDTDKSDKEAE